jgi:hypothetical protein
MDSTRKADDSSDVLKGTEGWCALMLEDVALFVLYATVRDGVMPGTA